MSCLEGSHYLSVIPESLAGLFKQMLMDALQFLPSQQISLCCFLHRHLTYVEGASFMTREKKLKEFNPLGLYSWFFPSWHSQLLVWCQAVSLFISVFILCLCSQNPVGTLRKYLWWIEYLLVLLSFSIELIFKSSIENMSWQVLGYFG